MIAFISLIRLRILAGISQSGIDFLDDTFFAFLFFASAVNQTVPQPTIACSKLKIETLEQDMKYVQS